MTRGSDGMKINTLSLTATLGLEVCRILTNSPTRAGIEITLMRCDKFIKTHHNIS